MPLWHRRREVGHVLIEEAGLLAVLRSFVSGLLAGEKKPKRKFCNTTAAGALKGDYAYEACGAFCKVEKKQNHCKVRLRPCLLVTASKPLSPRAVLARSGASAVPANSALALGALQLLPRRMQSRR